MHKLLSINTQSPVKQARPATSQSVSEQELDRITRHAFEIAKKAHQTSTYFEALNQFQQSNKSLIYPILRSLEGDSLKYHDKAVSALASLVKHNPDTIKHSLKGGLLQAVTRIFRQAPENSGLEGACLKILHNISPFVVFDTQTADQICRSELRRLSHLKGDPFFAEMAGILEVARTQILTEKAVRDMDACLTLLKERRLNVIPYLLEKLTKLIQCKSNVDPQLKLTAMKVLEAWTKQGFLSGSVYSLAKASLSSPRTESESQKVGMRILNSFVDREPSIRSLALRDGTFNQIERLFSSPNDDVESNLLTQKLYLSFKYSFDTQPRRKGGPAETVELGKGSFGRVYRGTIHESDGDQKKCAIKIQNIPNSGPQRTAFLNGYENERQVFERLRANNVPNVAYPIDNVSNGQTVVQTYDLYPCSLLDVMKIATKTPGRQPSESVIRAWKDQIQACVSAAHDAGVVHLDLKQENIMLKKVDPNGPDSWDNFQAMVLDWGFSSIRGDGFDQTMRGTPYYLSQSLIKKGRITFEDGVETDNRAVYQIEYEQFVGRRAFSGKDLAALYDNIVAGRLAGDSDKVPASERDEIIRHLANPASPIRRNPKENRLISPGSCGRNI